MKKDIQNERAVGAFRTYARLGLCREESALGIICRIRGICGDRTALDMIAVFDTLRLLEISGETLVLRAVKEIYLYPHYYRRNELTLRVRRLADELHCDDRSVYRYLKKARDLWLSLRQKEKKQTAGDRSLLSSMIGKIT
ncbi:MAG: hypothetical protein J6S71_06965 [Clostridia bacterium]|nr:hypothetical protein [Clostridia bacterium]